MILLMGIWINLTKKPINPIIAKPIAVAMAIFWNSAKKKQIPVFQKTDEILREDTAFQKAWLISIILNSKKNQKHSRVHNNSRNIYSIITFPSYPYKP